MTDETDFLKHHRTELAAAEKAFVKARENYRNTAERHGLPTSGIFSESVFVWRASAECWVADAEREGYARGRAEMIDFFKGAEDIDFTAFARLANANFDNEASRKLIADAIIAAGKKRRGEI
jgi:hypothetical protein